MQQGSSFFLSVFCQNIGIKEYKFYFMKEIEIGTQMNALFQHQPKTIPNRYVILKAKSKQKCCSVIVNEIYHGQNNRID